MFFFGPESTHWSKKGPIFTKDEPFLIVFFTKKTYLATTSHFFGPEKSLLVSKLITLAKKGLFEVF
jgi:hypothetical protein